MFPHTSITYVYRRVVVCVLHDSGNKQVTQITAGNVHRMFIIKSKKDPDKRAFLGSLLIETRKYRCSRRDVQVCLSCRPGNSGALQGSQTGRPVFLHRNANEQGKRKGVPAVLHPKELSSNNLTIIPCLFAAMWPDAARVQPRR